MLLKVHKTGIQIMDPGFFYMPSFILKNNIDNFNILLDSTRSTLTCFAITTFFVLNIGLASVYVSLTYFCGQRENANLTHAIIQSINSMMCLLTMLGVYIILPSISKKLPLVNQTLSQCQLNFKRKINSYKFSNKTIFLLHLI